MKLFITILRLFFFCIVWLTLARVGYDSLEGASFAGIMLYGTAVTVVSKFLMDFLAAGVLAVLFHRPTYSQATPDGARRWHTVVSSPDELCQLIDAAEDSLINKARAEKFEYPTNVMLYGSKVVSFGMLGPEIEFQTALRILAEREKAASNG